ncbi:dCTP deaminase [Amycolatopsis panacis]|uniref:dCTP deaminase n=1 Tax=Amycolatopsis panacis TaxID=2340917 RepID=A0A419HXA9_9PSEU|nr:dCTP deaminase [Amycolatopsis panacis]RJQ81690.1 dCTP deaminase [Amycolatopsis panacis]
MVLTDELIAAAVRGGEIVIDPFHAELSRPASHLLTLSGRFMRSNGEGGPIDPFLRSDVDSEFDPLFLADRVELAPGEFLLGATRELVSLPSKYFGRITGMSHLARLGLVVHVTSDLISPGFGFGAPTAITLELVNHHPRPIVLHEHMPVCHLQLARLETEPTKSYHRLPTGYTAAVQPTASRYWAEFGPGNATSAGARS